MSCGPSQVLCCLLCRSKCRKRFRFYFIFFYICLVPLAGFRRDAFRFDLFCFVTFASIVLFAVKFIAHFNAKKWSDVTSSHVISTRIHCSFGKSLFYEFYFIFIFASVRLRINKLNHAYFGFQLMQSNKKSRRIHFRICRRLSLTHQLIVDFHLDANEQYADRNKASVGNLNVTLIARQKRKMNFHRIAYGGIVLTHFFPFVLFPFVGRFERSLEIKHCTAIVEQFPTSKNTRRERWLDWIKWRPNRNWKHDRTRITNSKVNIFGLFSALFSFSIFCYCPTPSDTIFLYFGFVCTRKNETEKSAKINKVNRPKLVISSSERVYMSWAKIRNQIEIRIASNGKQFDRMTTRNRYELKLLSTR